MKSLNFISKPIFYLFAYWHDPRWNGFVGASVKIKDLAQNLSKMGNDVVLFLPKYHFKKNDFEHKLVQIPVINLPFLRSISFNIFLAFYLLFKLSLVKPSVVYVRRMNSVIPGLYAKLSKAKFIYEINDDPYEKKTEEGLKIIFFFRSVVSFLQDQFNIRLCDKAFVISHPLVQKILLSNPSLPSYKFCIMASGANTELLKPQNKIKCRTHLNLGIDTQIIGFAGTLLSHQGLEILIKAAPTIIQKIPHAIFLVIGEGPKRNEWESLVKKEGLCQNFVFAGQVSYEEMPTWIGATDICIAPYLSSAGLRSPVKIFDYMACGRAVIASKIKGTTDIFEKSGAISLVEPENHVMLSSKIIELIGEKKRLECMGYNARRFILRYFNRKSNAQLVFKEFEKLI